MNTSRKLRRRLLAVLLGLAVFPAIEVVCRVAGWGDSETAADPFVGFAGVRPLFQPDGSGSLQTAANRRGFFAEETFPARKPTGGFRIFVLGGSTVQGRPYSIETSFTSFLEIALHEAAPERTWEVINCGGVSYASYRLVPVMEECLTYEPDLFIVCTGHNEFLEDVSYRDIKDTPAAITASYRWLSELNSFRLIASVAQLEQATDTQPVEAAVVSEEVDALLDHQGGLEAYTRNRLNRHAVVRQYRHNLHRTVRIAREASVPLLFMLPPSNLQDCPPFKSEFGEDTSEASQHEIAALLTRAGSLTAAASAAEAVEVLETAAAMDSQFAFAWYQLGQAYLAAGRFDDAAAAFTKARDEDVCPLRMISDLEGTMRSVAHNRSTPLVEIAPLLHDRARHGIMGDAVLVDHIHPSFRSHEDIALRIADWMIERGVADVTQSNWHPAAEQAFHAHLQSLDNLYFLRGRRTLESLEGWTQGRAQGPPLVRQEE